MEAPPFSLSPPPSLRNIQPEGGSDITTDLGGLDNPIEALLDKTDRRLCNEEHFHGVFRLICHPAALLARASSGQPTPLCNDCVHCQFTRRFYHVGNQINLDHGLGNGTISRAIRRDGFSVVFEVQGRNVKRPTHTAYVKVPRPLARLSLYDAICYWLAGNTARPPVDERAIPLEMI